MEPSSPRTLSPEAFPLAPELVGRTLASPAQRLAAIALDLALIGALVLVLGSTRSFWLAVIGVGTYFVLAKKAPPRFSEKRHRLFATAGVCICLAVGVRTVDKYQRAQAERAKQAEVASTDDAGEEDAEADVTEPESDAPAAEATASKSQPSKPTGNTVSALAKGEGSEGATVTAGDNDPEGTADSAKPDAPEGAADSAKPETAAAPPTQGPASAEAAPAADVAAKQKAAHKAEVSRLKRTIRDLRSRKKALEERIERASAQPTVSGFFWSTLDDLGLGVGWMGLYFIGFLVLWRGQTPGKRLVGIRVVRLDGKRISWWCALERFQGYALSTSTLMMGFLRLYWDANLQCLHDRVADTLVLVEPAAALVPSTAKPLAADADIR
jgi:hypothetical protein